MFLLLTSTGVLGGIKGDVPAECQRLIDNIEDSDVSDGEKARLTASSSLSHTFIWENDTFAHGGDRHYTNGMKLSWMNNPCRQHYRRVAEWFDSLVGLHDKTPQGEKLESTVTTGNMFGMNMYTPNDITVATRNRNDRPYAGWLYIGAQVQSVSSIYKTDEQEKRGDWVDVSAHVLELQVGVIGPRAAQQQVQTWIHRDFTHSALPQGWDNQVSNQLGIDVLYFYRQHHFLDSRPTWLNVATHVGFSGGNVVNFVNLGGIVSIGDVGNDYPSTTIQPTFQRPDLPSILRYPDDAKKKEKPDETALPTRPFKHENLFYLFAGLDYRYVFSSIFIEGKDESAHDIQLVNDVYDVLYGVAYKTPWKKFSYKVINRSKEFNSNDPSLAKPHRFGQFMFEWYF